MKLFKSIVVLGLLQTGLFAAEVEKISKERDQILIAPEFGERFQVGDKVCVEGRSWKKVCGKVTRKKGSKAIAKMEEAVEGTRRGDPVSIQKTKSSSLDGGENAWEDSNWNERDSNYSYRSFKKKKWSGGELSFLAQAGLINPNFHSLESDSEFNKFRINSALGVGINIPFDEGTFSFEPTLNYVTKGAERSDESGMTAGLSLRYLELPLLFKVRFSQDDFSPFFIGGPYLAYLVSGVSYVGLNVPLVEFPVGETDIKESANDFDFGLTAGLGFDVAVSSSSRLGFQFLASWGLANLSNGTSEKITEAKNRHIGLVANVAFNL